MGIQSFLITLDKPNLITIDVDNDNVELLSSSDDTNDSSNNNIILSKNNDLELYVGIGILEPFIQTSDIRRNQGFSGTIWYSIKSHNQKQNYDDSIQTIEKEKEDEPKFINNIIPYQQQQQGYNNDINSDNSPYFTNVSFITSSDTENFHTAADVAVVKQIQDKSNSMSAFDIFLFSTPIFLCTLPIIIVALICMCVQSYKKNRNNVERFSISVVKVKKEV